MKTLFLILFLFALTSCDWLKGDKGKDGETGQMSNLFGPKGPNGLPGADGKDGASLYHSNPTPDDLIIWKKYNYPDGFNNYLADLPRVEWVGIVYKYSRLTLRMSDVLGSSVTIEFKNTIKGKKWQDE